MAASAGVLRISRQMSAAVRAPVHDVDDHELVIAAAAKTSALSLTGVTAYPTPPRTPAMTPRDAGSIEKKEAACRHGDSVAWAMETGIERAVGWGSPDVERIQRRPRRSGSILSRRPADGARGRLPELSFRLRTIPIASPASAGSGAYPQEGVVRTHAPL